MAELRGAGIITPDAQAAMARGLSGFTEAVIDRACNVLEMAPVEPFAPRMPTMSQMLEACRKESAEPETKSQFCGHCQHGRKRLGGVVVLCECVCPVCEGAGVVMVKPNGQPWDSRTDWKMDRCAKVCACRETQVARQGAYSEAS